VYTPLFSGVYWEGLNVPLEEVEQIEVVRGPGAALWGANAFNGVINIVTRSARDTQGGAVTIGSGSEERLFGSLRHGGRLWKDGHYRVYGKLFRRQASVNTMNQTANDPWDGTRVGLRADWDEEDRDRLTFQVEWADINLSDELIFFSPTSPYEYPQIETIGLSSGFLMGRWERRFSATADLSLQLYFDRFRQREYLLIQRNSTFDVDFQHRFALGGAPGGDMGIGVSSGRRSAARFLSIQI